MWKEKLSSASSFLTGLFFILIGILLLSEYTSFWLLVWVLLIVAFLWMGFNELILYRRTQRQKTQLLKAALLIGLVVIIAGWPKLFFRFLHIVIGWWALFSGIIQFLCFHVCRRDCTKGTYVTFLKGTIDLIFAAMLILRPFNKLWIVSSLAGAYLIFYGAITALEALKDLLSQNLSIRIRKHLRISVPVLLSALIPQRVFLSINALIKTQKLIPDDPTRHSHNTDLEVFIYLKESGPESLGHVDIAFQDQIYSYGCHDPHHRRLFGTLGDGVLIVADRDTFLHHALKSEDKTIISYGLTLSEQQRATLQQRIDQMMARTVAWKPDAQLQYEAQEEVSARDYASRVWQGTRAKMFKFTAGQFKTYFVFSTNCVLLADELLHCPQLDLIPISGIVTPGTYLEFLNTEYLRPGGIVTQRTVYKRTAGKHGAESGGSSFSSGSLSS